MGASGPSYIMMLYSLRAGRAEANDDLAQLICNQPIFGLISKNAFDYS